MNCSSGFARIQDNVSTDALAQLRLGRTIATVARLRCSGSRGPVCSGWNALAEEKKLWRLYLHRHVQYPRKLCRRQMRMQTRAKGKRVQLNIIFQVISTTSVFNHSKHLSASVIIVAKLQYYYHLW